MNNTNNNLHFTSASRVYFYTTDGKRIVSDKHLRTCERYLIRQLNGAKNLKSRNQELVDTFKCGDKDFSFISRARSVYEKAKGYVNVITGKDAKTVNEWGSKIGEAKKLSTERTGSKYSFETGDAIRSYNRKALNLVKEKGIYNEGKRQAFGIMFEPVYKKNGEFKEFKYHRSAWFNEEKITGKN